MHNIFPINNLYEYEYGLFNLNNNDVFFSDKNNTNNPFLISVVKDNHWLKIKPLSDNLITYEYIDNIIRYNNVFNDLNVECYVEDNRVVEKYINNSSRSTFEYDLKLSDTIKYETYDGIITFKEKVTNEVLWIISSENGYYSVKVSDDNLTLTLKINENLNIFINSIALYKAIDLPEIIEQRTEFAKVYDTGTTDDNGSKIYQKHIYLKPIHIKTIEDKYEEIDLNIKQTDKYEFEWINETNNFISYFGDKTKANNHLTSFEIINSNGIVRWINFKILNGNSAITNINDNKIKYEDVLENIDLEYIITDNQQKENIYLKSPNTSKSITFTLKLDGVYLEKQENIILFKDIDTNEVLWFIDKPFMYDSSDVPIRSDNVDYLLGNTTLDTLEYTTLTVYANDEQFFSSATYPIIIDPTVTIQPDATAGIDSYVYSANPSNNYGSIVFFNVGTSGNSTPYRTYIQFDLSSVSSYAITGATLSLYCNSGSNTLSRVINLHRVIDTWNESLITWNTKSNYDATVITSAIVGSFDSWYNFNVTSLINLFLNNTYTNNGFLLKFSDETINGYKSFMSSDNATASQRPKLIIDYTVPPIAPTNLQATVQSSSRILWSWTDNSTDETYFKLKDSGNQVIQGAGKLYSEDGLIEYADGNIPANVYRVIEKKLSAGSTYTRRVVSFNANGESTTYAQAVATTNNLTHPNILVGTKNTLNDIKWTITKT